MIKIIFGEILNMFKHFNKPIKELFKIIFDLICQQKKAQS